MAVNIKMGVDASGFKQSIADANAQLKSLDAQLKLADTTMKATGNSEQGLVTKTNALNEKLKTQKQLIQQYEKALQNMKNAGVDPLSKEYQKLQTALLNAKTGMVETEAALNGLTGSEQQAAAGADKLNQSVNSIGKKMSLDQIRSGIDKIATGLEGAAKKAEQFAKALWGGVEDSAQRGDDIATAATMLGLDIESYQRYQKVFDTVGEVTVQEWMKAKTKVQSAILKTTPEQFDIFAALGVGLRDVNGTVSPYYNKYVIGKAREWEDVFWDVGKALREKVASGELSQDQADVYAQAIFGKSFASLNNLFAMGREGFYEAYNNQNVTSEESIKRLADLNDQLIKLEGDFKSLQDEVLAGLAPALTKGAEALDGLLGKLIEYLQKPEGQEMLEKLGTAVSGLFDNLAEIDPEKVVEGFTKVFTDIVGGVQWLVDNREGVFEALKWIVGAWGTLEITGGILDIVKVVSGLAELTGIKAAGEAAGAAWGSSFASAVLKAAPWLAGLIALLKPSTAQDNSLVDTNGNLTEEGIALQAQQQAEDDRLANRTDRERWLDEMAAKYNGTMGISAVNMMMFGHDPIYEAIQDYWDKYRMGTATTEDWTNLQGTMDSKKWEQFMQVAKFMYSLDRATEDLPDEAFGFNENFDEWLKENEDGMPIMIDPVIPDNAAKGISEEIGPVMVPVQLVVQELTDEEAQKWFNGEANGIWNVPYDGYLARLHKGERVVPAREVAASRNFSSNLYVESMYMSGGADAEGLASAMAAAQRRTLSGYGS